MAKKNRLYTRLTRPAMAFGHYNSLWVGPDHLLQVISTGYTESYQRFDFRDIQTFYVGKSHRRMAWAWFWGVIMVVAAVTLASTLNNGGVPFVAGPFLVISLVLFIVNFSLGPTCTVHLVTRVQMLQLASLVRWRKLDRVLDRLRPLIEQAQASLVVPAPDKPKAP